MSHSTTRPRSSRTTWAACSSIFRAGGRGDGDVVRSQCSRSMAPDAQLTPVAHGCDGGLRQQPSLGAARSRSLGHEARLIAPGYVKPFVKRQKNDAADAEAICEAAQRPTMRFVAVKERRAAGRGRDVSRPRSSGPSADPDDQCDPRPSCRVRVGGRKRALPCRQAGGCDRGRQIRHSRARPRSILHLLVEQLRLLDERVAVLDREVARRAKADAEAKTADDDPWDRADHRDSACCTGAGGADL